MLIINDVLLLLLIYTRCNIILRQFMRKKLHILQKENSQKKEKSFYFTLIVNLISRRRYVV